MNRKPGFLAAATLIAASLALTLAGCTATTHPSPHDAKPVSKQTSVTSPKSATTSPVTVCPAESVRPVGKQVRDDRVLLPFVPTRALVCTYGTIDEGKTKVYNGVVTNPAALSKLRAALNSTTPMPAGPTNCPADFGSVVDIYFSAGRVTSEVAVNPTGCETATDGSSSGLIDARAMLSPLGALPHSAIG
jgi:hypothetical protein